MVWFCKIKFPFICICKPTTAPLKLESTPHVTAFADFDKPSQQEAVNCLDSFTMSFDSPCSLFWMTNLNIVFVFTKDKLVNPSDLVFRGWDYTKCYSPDGILLVFLLGTCSALGQKIIYESFHARTYSSKITYFTLFKITVLENRRVIEQGPHDVLSGRYSQLWTQQNSTVDAFDAAIKLEA